MRRACWLSRVGVSHDCRRLTAFFSSVQVDTLYDEEAVLQYGQGVGNDSRLR